MSVPDEMRAAVYRARADLQVQDRPVPVPGPHEVLLEISHCGVCGTDLHMVMEGWGRPDSIGGHEYSGEIAALGANVSGWSIGDAVVGGPTPGCGRCAYCLAHRPGLCTEASTPGVGAHQGAFAQYKCVHESQLLRVPDGLSLREAALCEPLAVALHGITLSGVQPGQRALITGVGPIGMLTLAALRARGVDDVTVSEPSAARRELARKVGAARVLEPGDLQVPSMPYVIVDDAYHAVFECSGRGSALEAAIAQLAKGGTAVILGTGMDRPALDSIRVLLGELIVTGAYNYDEDGFPQAIAMLASGALPTDLLIDADDVPLERLLPAMERLVEGGIGGKVLVAPNSERRSERRQQGPATSGGETDRNRFADEEDER